VQILLLLCCLACAHGQYNNYMIGPTSYLDVVRPPSGSHVPSASNTEAGLQQQGRTLRQAASRFDKPYNVCVSDWLPMVSCTPDDDHTTFTGETGQTERQLYTSDTACTGVIVAIVACCIGGIDELCSSCEQHLGTYMSKRDASALMCINHKPNFIC
jgi:hypothetical protein